MKKLAYTTFLALTVCYSSLAADYIFVDRQHPRQMEVNHLPWHLEGDYRHVDKQKFRTHGVKGSRLNYADANASLYFSHFLSQHNSLTWEVGYSYLKLDWDKNPRFSQSDFHYGLFSLTYGSTSVEKWRWLVNAGFSIDTERFDFGQSAVYYGMLWGRYHYTDHIGLHIGLGGYAGLKNGYMLPILGFDWQFAKRWKLDAIFPIDISLDYTLSPPSWTLSLAYVNFGGPYRYPRRAHGGSGKFHDAIFEVFSRGLELDLNYKYKGRLTAGIGAGYNFGGWIQIKSASNHHGKYYKFDAAPYVQANLGYSF